MTDDMIQARAERLFRKEQQALEGREAMAEYEAQAKALRKRTERLRALRLAQPPTTAVKKPQHKK